jgi:hypothetical protein
MSQTRKEMLKQTNTKDFDFLVANAILAFDLHSSLRFVMRRLTCFVDSLFNLTLLLEWILVSPHTFARQSISFTSRIGQL